MRFRLLCIGITRCHMAPSWTKTEHASKHTGWPLHQPDSPKRAALWLFQDGNPSKQVLTLPHETIWQADRKQCFSFRIPYVVKCSCDKNEENSYQKDPVWKCFESWEVIPVRRNRQGKERLWWKPCEIQFPTPFSPEPTVVEDIRRVEVVNKISHKPEQ